MPNTQTPMTTEGGWSQSDREELGVLRTRMTNVERAIQAVGDNVAALSAKFDRKSEIPWQALGVMLAFVGMIGGALYWPIREGQSELKTAMVELTKTVSRDYVTIRELDTRAERTRTDQSRLREDIQSLERETVPRAEHVERWRSTEREFVGMQRQIDDVKRWTNELAPAKDFLRTLDDRMRALERRP